MIWFYAENNSQAGPVSDEQLRELVSAGRIQGATLVWKAGMDAWTPLSQAVPGLAAVGAPSQAVAAPAVMTDTAIVRQKPFGTLGPETALCSSCGQFKPLDELVQIAGQRICAQCKPLALQKLQQGEVPAHLNYAGFWIRVGAVFLDGIVMAPVSLLINFFLLPKLFAISINQSFEAQAITQLVGFALNAAYKTFFNGRFGATPGKMIAGLKIVRADGSPIGYGLAALRMLAEYLNIFTLGIGYLMVAFDDQKRGLHDRLCNTRVIRK